MAKHLIEFKFIGSIKKFFNLYKAQRKKMLRNTRRNTGQAVPRKKLMYMPKDTAVHLARQKVKTAQERKLLFS